MSGTGRRIEVPLNWADPSEGTFSLYYEVDSAYDPGRPTVMVPCDPQQSESWEGAADRMRRDMGIEDNVVVFQYRGTHASAIPRLGNDWVAAYRWLHTRNGVEDMDAVRRDLLGDDGVLRLAGGSGLAMMGLMYLVTYHRHVDRAFLMGLYHQAAAGCRAVEEFLDDFLARHGLQDAFAAAMAEGRARKRQLFHLLQRLLYSDQDKARRLVAEVGAGDLSLYRSESERLGDVDEFIAEVQRRWPQTVVFMYETNVPPPDGRVDGINEPFLAMGAPLWDLARQGLVPDEHMDVRGLGAVGTDVLLVAGTRDQVCPIELMTSIYDDMPAARLLVLHAYHCLVRQPERRARLLNTFFRFGGASEALRDLLRSDDFAEVFVELRERASRDVVG